MSHKGEMQKLISMRASHERSREGGFILLEFVIGSLAVVLALGAVISAVLQVSRLRKVDEELNLAYIACMSNIEDLRSVPLADLPAMNGVGFDVPALNGTLGGLTPLPGDADGLAGQFTVTMDKTGGGTTLYRVVTEVQWIGTAGRQSFRLESLMGQRTLN